MTYLKITILCLLITLIGCAGYRTQVTPIEVPMAQLTDVCLKTGGSSHYAFLGVVKQRLNEIGLKYREIPSLFEADGCKTIISYVARYEVNLWQNLKSAYIEVSEDGKVLGFARYQGDPKNILNSGSIELKIKSLVDRLFNIQPSKKKR